MQIRTLLMQMIKYRTLSVLLTRTRLSPLCTTVTQGESRYDDLRQILLYSFLEFFKINNVI